MPVRHLPLLLRLVAASLIALLVCSPVMAQEQDGQLWTTTTVEQELDDNLTGSIGLVVRFSDAADGLSQTQLGADLETETAAGVALGGGYSYVTSHESGDVTSREHRLRQQVGAGLGRLAGGEIGGRLRLEQRWRDDGDDMMLRLRPRITWTHGIGTDRLALRLMHESFLILNDTDWGGEASYERMRHQISLRRRIGAVLTGELGYLNQYSFGAGEPDEMDHALTVAVTFGF